MKINIKNENKIDSALQDVNGKAVSHTYSAQDVRRLAIAAETELKSRGIDATQRKGAIYKASGAGPAAASYQYRVITTMVKLERGARDWFLVDAERDQARPKQKERQNIFISSSEAK
jgi:hypothetical protein